MNILITHTKWQLNEVQLQIFKSFRGKSEAFGDKNSSSRVMDSTGQTLLIMDLTGQTLQFIEVSPPISINNLSS